VNIATFQHLTEHRALEIHIAGCKKPHCDGCFNGNINNFDCGTFLDEEMAKMILAKLHIFDKKFDRVWLVGGEPLDQNVGCLQYLLEVINRTGKEIWMFTRYEIEQIPSAILSKCAYVKCGPFDKNLTDEKKIQYGVSLGSSNQKIYKRGYDY